MLGPLEDEKSKPLVDAPATLGDFEPADIPQLDGADPDLDTLDTLDMCSML